MHVLKTDPIHGERRAPRYSFGGVVELTDLESGGTKVAMVRTLSLYGCLVKTDMAVQETARIALRIAHSGIQFSALGRVVNCVENQGLGIEFIEVEAGDKIRLEACLTELAAAPQ